MNDLSLGDFAPRLSGYPEIRKFLKSMLLEIEKIWDVTKHRMIFRTALITKDYPAYKINSDGVEKACLKSLWSQNSWLTRKDEYMVVLCVYSFYRFSL